MDDRTIAVSQEERQSRGGQSSKPSESQRKWLTRGLEQPGGKLPLFDADGQKISARTVESCIKQGWAEPWYNNPIKPDWLVCKLTDSGRQILDK